MPQALLVCYYRRIQRYQISADLVHWVKTWMGWLYSHLIAQRLR